MYDECGCFPTFTSHQVLQLCLLHHILSFNSVRSGSHYQKTSLGCLVRARYKIVGSNIDVSSSE